MNITITRGCEYKTTCKLYTSKGKLERNMVLENICFSDVDKGMECSQASSNTIVRLTATNYEKFEDENNCHFRNQESVDVKI